MDEDYEIRLILNEADQADYLLEIIDKSLELLESGRIAEAVFYLRSAAGEEIDLEH